MPDVVWLFIIIIIVFSIVCGYTARIENNK